MSLAVRTLFSRKRLREETQKREFKPLSDAHRARSGARRAPEPRAQRYRVDLAGQQADCDANYLRLRKILPDLTERDEWCFDIGAGPAERRLRVSVVERAPYTTTLEMSQPQSGRGAGQPRAPRLTICMYHDADMAEVVAWEHHRRLRGRYPYPNPRMYHADEKAQLNRFLAEWLSLCQAQGRPDLSLAQIGLYK